MLLITDSPGKDEGTLGVVTLEDVAEVHGSDGKNADWVGIDRKGDHRVFLGRHG